MKDGTSEKIESPFTVGRPKEKFAFMKILNFLDFFNKRYIMNL